MSDERLNWHLWQTLAGHYCKKEKIISGIFERLQESYSGAGRYYHTAEHIHQLLRLSASFRKQLSAPDTVDFSIWFHDVVYIPGNSMNEVESAAMARESLQQLGLPPDDVAKVCSYILATGDHLSTQTEDGDLKYFLDFDLSILAAEKEDYRLYVDSVRKEFSAFPDFIYNPGRADFLRKMLSRRWLFFTEAYKKRESSARENMEWELEKLQGAQ